MRVPRYTVLFAATLVAAVFLTCVQGRLARADDFGLGGAIPDDLEHSFCFDFPLERPPNMFVALFLYWGFHNVMEATDYTEAYDPTCNSETDVIFQLSDLMPWAGFASCREVTPTGFCRSWVVTINPHAVVGVHDMISLSCHEVGHTLGLSDGPGLDDCMSTGFTWSTTLNAHHVAHANSRRPHDDPNH